MTIANLATQSADGWQQPLPKKMVQDTSYEVCHAASLVQVAMSSANLAAQHGRPHDMKQCLSTVRSLTNTINMHMDRLQEMMPK